MFSLGLSEGKILIIDTVSQNKLNAIKNHDYFFSEKLVLGS